MKTINVQWIDRLKRAVKFLGFAGMISSATVNSVVGLFFSLLLMVFTEWLINERAWLYVGRATCVLHEGRVLIGQTAEACYARRRDLPKGYKTFTITKKDREAVIELDLFVLNLVHGGTIIPLALKITCGVDMDPGPLSLYCEHFKERGETTRGHILAAVKVFQQEQHPISGVFGGHYSTTMGYGGWIELILKPRLRRFLEESLSLKGVIVKEIEVFQKKGGRCILQERKEG